MYIKFIVYLLTLSVVFTPSFLFAQKTRKLIQTSSDIIVYGISISSLTRIRYSEKELIRVATLEKNTFIIHDKDYCETLATCLSKSSIYKRNKN